MKISTIIIRWPAPAIFLAAILAAPLYAKPNGGEWKSSQLIQPEELVKLLSSKSKSKPLVFQVGFEFLYRSGHIPGSAWAGPASRPEGIDKLKAAVKDVAKNKAILLYCGCCPWTDCPNIRPAFDTMEKLGFKNVKAVYLPSSFEKDWIKKGYPTKMVEATKE